MGMQTLLRSRAWRGVMVAAAVVTGAALAVAGRAVAQQQNFDNVQIDTVKVRDNVYMLVGDGANIVVQTGDQGAFVVDTGEGKLAEMAHEHHGHQLQSALEDAACHQRPRQPHKPLHLRCRGILVALLGSSYEQGLLYA
jgi:hypothetical protein